MPRKAATARWRVISVFVATNSMAKLPAKYLEMRQWSLNNDDTPDGAFFAMAEEMMGWDVDDWVWYAEIAAQDPYWATPTL